jgi:hypothetical protein
MLHSLQFLFYQNTDIGHIERRRLVASVIAGGSANISIQDVHVVNSPAHCFAVSNPGPLTISGVTVDDCVYSHFSSGVSNFDVDNSPG